MPYPQINAGMRLTASLLTDMQWKEVEQIASQQVNNSTTFVDTNIVIPTIAGARYLYRLLVGYATNDTADIQFRWQTAGTGEVRRFSAGPGVSGTGTADCFTDVSMRRPLTDTSVRIGGNSSSLTYHYEEHGVIIGDGTNAVPSSPSRPRTPPTPRSRDRSRVDYLRIG